MDKIKVLALIFIPIIIAGCTASNYKGVSVDSAPLSVAGAVDHVALRSGSEANYAIMEVFFATDRKQNDTSSIKSFFGASRGDLSYGKS